MYTGQLVRLRRADPSRDLEDRYRWMNDPAVVDTLGMRPGRLSREEIRKYLELTASASDSMVEWAIETHEGIHIGGCAIRNFDQTARSAELGIAIGEAAFRSKGYGTDAVRLLVMIGFAQFNLNRIWLRANAGNTAGIRAYEKAGFTREGLLRQYGFINGRYYDSVIMAILREEYESGKGRAS